MATLKTDKAKQLWEKSSKVSRLKWLNENKFKKGFAEVNFEKLHENVSKKLVELSKTKTKLYEADQTEIVNAYNKSIEGNLDRAGAISAVARDMNIDAQEVEDALTAVGINEADSEYKEGDKVLVKDVKGKDAEGVILSIDGDMAQVDFDGDKYGITLNRIIKKISEDDADGVVNTGELSASIWDSSDEATREAWLTKNGLDVELKTKLYAELPDEAKSKMGSEVTAQVDNLGEGLIADAIKKSVAKNFGINPEGEVTNGSTKSKKLPTFEKFNEGIVMDQAKKTNANTSKIPAAGEVKDGDTKSLPQMYEAHRAWKNFDAVKKAAWLVEKKFDKTLVDKYFGKLPKNVMEGFIADMADKSASKNFGIPVSGKTESGSNKKAALPVMEGTTKGRLNEWNQNFGIPVNGKVERLAQELPSIKNYIAEHKKLFEAFTSEEGAAFSKIKGLIDKDGGKVTVGQIKSWITEFFPKDSKEEARKEAKEKLTGLAGLNESVNECIAGESYVHEDGNGNVYNVTCKTMSGDKGTFTVDEILEKGTNTAKVGDTLTLTKEEMYDMAAANMAEDEETGTSFAKDEAKMADFNSMEKVDFLAKYTDVTDKDYETTKLEVGNINETVSEDDKKEILSMLSKMREEGKMDKGDEAQYDAAFEEIKKKFPNLTQEEFDKTMLGWDTK